jgi:hypothetical protein
MVFSLCNAIQSINNTIAGKYTSKEVERIEESAYPENSSIPDENWLDTF